MPFQVHGQMTMWPDVEFWVPQLNLVGYFSVGSVLVVSSLGVLTMLSVSLLAHNFLRKFNAQSTGSFAGAVVASLSTSACCSGPVILPALLAILGISSANPLLEGLTFQIESIFNLLDR
ncbi:MAG: hypothetical protein M1587_05570 [Thaumarchaeota archaeon]|nr:hypothetical protein [Nitrososphaerota archaeon]